MPLGCRPARLMLRFPIRPTSMSAFPLPLLLLIFIGAAVGVWFAGIQLSQATDLLSKKYGFGQALGGLILLAIATNLPEIAITASGAIQGDVSLAVGNILGGIALQTVVLVLLDVFGMGKKIGLTYSASSLELVIEGIIVMAVLTVTVMGTQLPKDTHDSVASDARRSGDCGGVAWGIMVGQPRAQGLALAG